MENTLTMFENQVEKKWFVAVEERLLGPVSGKEVALWVVGGEISLVHFAWHEGMSRWQRLLELKDFKSLLPTEPEPALMAQARTKLHKQADPAGEPPAAPRVWFLFMNDSQYGPFSANEVQLMADAGRVNAHTYVWKKGMADWVLAPSVTELGLKLSAPQAKGAKSEKRVTPRKPFEAKLLLTNGQEVGWALCRDISIGGMQVLIDRVPGGVGTTLKLNVTAAGDIPAFACDGEIVRVLEDGRGFSFRFTSLPAKAKAAIEKYIS